MGVRFEINPDQRESMTEMVRTMFHPVHWRFDQAGLWFAKEEDAFLFKMTWPHPQDLRLG
jgi:hypothetical protein